MPSGTEFINTPLFTVVGSGDLLFLATNTELLAGDLVLYAGHALRPRQNDR